MFRDLVCNKVISGFFKERVSLKHSSSRTCICAWLGCWHVGFKNKKVKTQSENGFIVQPILEGSLLISFPFRLSIYFSIQYSISRLNCGFQMSGFLKAKFQKQFHKAKTEKLLPFSVLGDKKLTLKLFFGCLHWDIFVVLLHLCNYLLASSMFGE